MPRKRRFILPDFPCHIMQRARTGERIFREVEEFHKYLLDVQDLRTKLGVRIYAWCLLSDQVNLLLDPMGDPQRISEFMKSLSVRTVRRHNRIAKLNGRLWDGRYRSSPVQWGPWSLSSMRYIETLPLSMAGVEHIDHYDWSSHVIRMGFMAGYPLDNHPDYLALHSDETERQKLYRRLLTREMGDAEWCRIHNAIHRSQLTGDDRFIDQVEKATGVRMARRGPGRPKGSLSRTPRRRKARRRR